MKKIIPALKVYWADNQTAILVSVAVTSLTVVLLMKKGLSQHDAFLKEHGLYDAFYLPEE